MKIGRKLYFEKSTGNIIIDTGERQGSVTVTTVEQDIAAYTELSERNRETFEVLELPFGAYAQDFAESNGYRVNVETKMLEFSERDLNNPEAPPVYQPPLSEQVKTLEDRQAATEEAINFLLGL